MLTTYFGAESAGLFEIALGGVTEMLRLGKDACVGVSHT